MNVNFYTEVVIDETTVSSLTEMGFPFEACRKAVYHTKNAGVEPAMNWVMEHMGDPGLNDTAAAVYYFLITN